MQSAETPILDLLKILRQTQITLKPFIKCSKNNIQPKLVLLDSFQRRSTWMTKISLKLSQSLYGRSKIIYKCKRWHFSKNRTLVHTVFWILLFPISDLLHLVLCQGRYICILYSSILYFWFSIFGAVPVCLGRYICIFWRRTLKDDFPHKKRLHLHVPPGIFHEN